MPINNSMTLEQAWNLLELLNEDANRQASDLWSTNEIIKAIQFQSLCFKKGFLALDNNQQQMIQYWIENDDEFQDYFKCLSGDE